MVMAGSFNLRAIISAVDRLSPVLRAQARTLNTWKRQFAAAGKGAIPMAAGLGAGLAIPAKAFMDVENASIGLKNTLMNKNGISSGFESISKIATGLGNQLPGTTADFMNMASQLNGLGVNADTIAGGALKATAYLAVVGERFDVTYESAADAVGKLGKALGIADNDLVPFADTLQRALHMGTDLTQVQYAMTKVAPRLKGLNIQGLGVANDLVPLAAMLTSMGISGEAAGTGIEKMIAGAVSVGKFKGVTALVHDLEKMHKLAPAKMMDKMKKLFGDEGERVGQVIAAGGYDKMVSGMKNQADLQQRINNSLGTLTNLWEGATGTFTNALAAFGEVYAPELKQLSQLINDVSGKLIDWATNNGPAIRIALKMAGAFIGLKLGFLAAAAVLGVLTKVMLSNPIMLLVQAIAIAAPYIYEHWGEITQFMKISWNDALVWIDAKFQTFVDGLLLAVNAVRSIFNFSDISVTLPKLSDSFSIVPNVPSVPQSLNAPSVPSVPQSLNTPSVPSVPQSLNAPSVPSVPQSLNTPSVPSVPQSLNTPSVPSVPKPPSAPASGFFANADQSDGSMALPGAKSPAQQQREYDAAKAASRKNIVQASAPAVKGSIEINFNNAPAAMRVEPAKTSGPVSVRPNVGYRSFATGTS